MGDTMETNDNLGGSIRDESHHLLQGCIYLSALKFIFPSIPDTPRPLAFLTFCF